MPLSDPAPAWADSFGARDGAAALNVRMDDATLLLPSLALIA